MARVEIGIDDYLAAQWTHFWSLRRRVTLIMALLAAFAFFPGWWHGSPVTQLIWIAPFIGACALIGGILGMAMTLPLATRRLYRQAAKLGWTLDWNWDEKGIELIGRGSQSRYAWGDFMRLREGSQTVLLYLTDWNWLMIPKRALTGNEVGELKRHVEQARATA